MTDPADHDDSTLSTGDETVDLALERLAELDDRDLTEHADVYDDVHRSLRGALDAPAADGDAPGSVRRGVVDPGDPGGTG